jgi:hypothetical protein
MKVAVIVWNSIFPPVGGANTLQDRLNLLEVGPEGRARSRKTRSVFNTDNKSRGNLLAAVEMDTTIASRIVGELVSDRRRTFS